MSQFTTFGQSDSPLARHNPYPTTVYQKSDKNPIKIQSKIQIQIQNPNPESKSENPNPESKFKIQIQNQKTRNPNQHPKLKIIVQRKIQIKRREKPGAQSKLQNRKPKRKAVSNPKAKDKFHKP
jgi:hypothetical protein